MREATREVVAGMLKQIERRLEHVRQKKQVVEEELADHVAEITQLEQRHAELLADLEDAS